MLTVQEPAGFETVIPKDPAAMVREVAEKAESLKVAVVEEKGLNQVAVVVATTAEKAESPQEPARSPPQVLSVSKQI
tara:strand:- start:801 stop:1031 length:231 start_codon:yes stop_codon:yes gene_type:complete